MQTQIVTPDSLHSNVERLYGYNFQEDSAAAALIYLRDGSSSGDIIKTIRLAPNQFVDIALPKGVFWEFPAGCYVDESSGSVAGSLYF